MKKILQSDTNEALAATTGVSVADVNNVLNAYEDFILKNINEGNELELYGLGKFEPVTIKPRSIFSPLTDRVYEIGETKTFQFDPSNTALVKLNSL